MYTRYYDNYSAKPNAEQNNVAEEIVPKGTFATEDVSCNTQEGEITTSSVSAKKIFGNMGIDDILLIAVIFIIASDSSDDFLMPLILGALLLG